MVPQMCGLLKVIPRDPSSLGLPLLSSQLPGVVGPSWVVSGTLPDPEAGTRTLPGRSAF